MSQRVDVGDNFVDVAIVESTQAEAVATQTQLFISNQMSTFASKQTCHMSTLSRRTATVVLHFDIITGVTTFRDVCVLFK